MDVQHFLEQSAARHNHLCPRQVLGVRMGLAGMAAIGLDAPMLDKAAMVLIETDGCFADGIEVASGALVGHRTLRVVDMGKIGAVFANKTTGRAIRLAPWSDVRSHALAYAPDIRAKYYAQLKGYQVMPDGDLFSIQEEVLDPTLDVLISRPGIRTKCLCYGEEIINGRQVCVDGECLCRTCAGEGHYRLK